MHGRTRMHYQPMTKRRRRHLTGLMSRDRGKKMKCVRMYPICEDKEVCLVKLSGPRTWKCGPICLHTDLNGVAAENDKVAIIRTSVNPTWIASKALTSEYWRADGLPLVPSFAYEYHCFWLWFTTVWVESIRSFTFEMFLLHELEINFFVPSFLSTTSTFNSLPWWAGISSGRWWLGWIMEMVWLVISIFEINSLFYNHIAYQHMTNDWEKCPAGTWSTWWSLETYPTRESPTRLILTQIHSVNLNWRL